MAATRQQLLAQLLAQQPNVAAGAASGLLDPATPRPTPAAVDTSRRRVALLEAPFEAPHTSPNQIAPVDASMVTALANIGRGVWSGLAQKKADAQSRQLLADELSLQGGKDPFASDLQPIAPPSVEGVRSMPPVPGSTGPSADLAAKSQADAQGAETSGLRSFLPAAADAAEQEAPAMQQHDVASLLDPRVGPLAAQRLNLGKTNEPYTLGPGQVRMMGNQVIGKNPNAEYKLIPGPDGSVLQQSSDGKVTEVLGRAPKPGNFELFTAPNGATLQRNKDTNETREVIPAPPVSPQKNPVAVNDPKNPGHGILVDPADAVGQEPYNKPPASTLSVKDAQLANNKLIMIGLAKQQLATLKQKFDAIKGSMSAGPSWTGQGFWATQAGKQFDAAIDSMRQTITSLTRTPGIGSMSNYETGLMQAQMPARNEYEAVTQQKIDSLANSFDTLETGYKGMLEPADGSGPPPPSGGGPPPPGGTPPPAAGGKAPPEAEAEVRANPALRDQFVSYFGYDPLAQP